jgi:hypothetical protein
MVSLGVKHRVVRRALHFTIVVLWFCLSVPVFACCVLFQSKESWFVVRQNVLAAVVCEATLVMIAICLAAVKFRLHRTRGRSEIVGIIVVAVAGIASLLLFAEMGFRLHRMACFRQRIEDSSSAGPETNRGFEAGKHMIACAKEVRTGTRQGCLSFLSTCRVRPSSTEPSARRRRIPPSVAHRASIPGPSTNRATGIRSIRTTTAPQDRRPTPGCTRRRTRPPIPSEA